MIILFCCLLIFFKINFFEGFFQEYHQSVQQIGSRSGLTFCQACQSVCKHYEQKTQLGNELNDKFYIYLKNVVLRLSKNSSLSLIWYTVKSVLSGHSKMDKTKVLKTIDSLMKAESIAECF